MKSPLVNLIASTDVEVIENILSAGVYDPRNLKNQNLLFPVDEDLQFRHLIRFNHNWNLPNIGASLTFIDPDGTFERDFLAKGKLLSSKLASVLGTFPKKSFGGGTSTGIGQVLPESVEDLPSSTAEEQPLGKIYIAYGYGTDFETWSGPHSFFVATSRIDYSDKARTITLELTPISNAGAGIILPLENPVSIEGISPIFALTDGITPGTKHERPGMEGLALDRARFADRYHQENAGDLFGVPPADLNNYIMTALENYARSAFGTGDILLLLPDLVANNAQGFCDDHAQSIYRHAKLGISESETFDQYGNLRGTQKVALHSFAESIGMQLDLYGNDMLDGFEQLRIRATGSNESLINYFERYGGYRDTFKAFIEDWNFTISKRTVVPAGVRVNAQEGLYNVFSKLNSSRNSGEPAIIPYKLHIADLSEVKALYDNGGHTHIDPFRPATLIGDKSLIIAAITGRGPGVSRLPERFKDLHKAGAQIVEEKQYFQPEEMYHAWTENQGQKAEAVSLPKFIYNKNVEPYGNILELGLENQEFMLHHLNLGFSKLIGLVDDYVAENDVLPVNPQLAMNSTTQSVHEAAQPYLESYAGGGTWLGSIESMIGTLGDHLKNPGPKLVQHFKPNSISDTDPAARYMEEILNRLGRVINIKLKTLPFFSINKVSDLFQECQLDVQNLQYHSPQGQIGGGQAYFSGQYFIAGWSHTIEGTGNAYSEFVLSPSN